MESSYWGRGGVDPPGGAAVDAFPAMVADSVPFSGLLEL